MGLDLFIPLRLCTGMILFNGFLIVYGGGDYVWLLKMLSLIFFLYADIASLPSNRAFDAVD